MQSTVGQVTSMLNDAEEPGLKFPFRDLQREQKWNKKWKAAYLWAEKLHCDAVSTACKVC